MREVWGAQRGRHCPGDPGPGSPGQLCGHPQADPGVTGQLGTISRTDGTTQATYDGHPLYTYIGDSAPGQDSGNNVNLNGGLWHVVPISG